MLRRAKIRLTGEGTHIGKRWVGPPTLEDVSVVDDEGEDLYPGLKAWLLRGATPPAAAAPEGAAKEGVATDSGSSSCPKSGGAAAGAKGTSPAAKKAKGASPPHQTSKPRGAGEGKGGGKGTPPSSAPSRAAAQRGSAGKGGRRNSAPDSEAEKAPAPLVSRVLPHYSSEGGGSPPNGRASSLSNGGSVVSNGGRSRSPSPQPLKPFSPIKARVVSPPPSGGPCQRAASRDARQSATPSPDGRPRGGGAGAGPAKLRASPPSTTSSACSPSSVSTSPSPERKPKVPTAAPQPMLGSQTIRCTVRPHTLSNRCALGVRVCVPAGLPPRRLVPQPVGAAPPALGLALLRRRGGRGAPQAGAPPRAARAADKRLAPLAGVGERQRASSGQPELAARAAAAIAVQGERRPRAATRARTGMLRSRCTRCPVHR